LHCSMKESLSSFDVTAAVKDLQALVGGHIDKVYHPSLDHLVLAVRNPGEGKSYIHFHVGAWLYISAKGGEMPQQPSDFAMMLRKRITNARIKAVRQQGFERIAVLELDKEERFDLVLELFGDGNAILVTNGTIVQPLTSHTWKHRDVRARKPFMYPPPVPDPSALTEREFLDILHSSDTDLVRTMATKLNIGGRYSEEICARTGTNKSSKASETSETTAMTLLETIRGFKAEVGTQGKGYVVTKSGALEDVVPLKLRIHEELTFSEFPTFSAAEEDYVARIPAPVKEEKREKVLEQERIKRKLAQQEAAIISLQDEGRETQIIGDFIYANYEEVARLLSAAKNTPVKNKQMKDIPGFVSYEPRNSVMRVKVKTAVVSLDVKQSVEGNARRYYEAAKKARKKLEGAIAALEEARLGADKLAKGERAPDETAKPKRKPTKKFWFERFRWFVSSEGAVVLGGKDAKSNDMLVKKHLEAGDRYAHADVHGAPSVVVKMKQGVTEKTLHEACEFAVATSKAWNAKIGSAAGYWVLPEQVSKTPQSGEYLAKGAFVIRGRRNYSDKLAIKLGVGEIEFEGNRKIMCGPEGAVRTLAKRYIIIRPGNIDKNALAKRLADAFEVPIEEIQSILPPGDVEIVEQVDISIS
jgi:predicted ribosome quality control (RQC) complex YloA/Tae2 family protein